MALQRVVMNLDEELVKKVDAYAQKLHINRTASVSVLLSAILEEKAVLAAYPDLMAAIQTEQKRLGKEEK